MLKVILTVRDGSSVEKDLDFSYSENWEYVRYFMNCDRVVLGSVFDDVNLEYYVFYDGKIKRLA